MNNANQSQSQSLCALTEEQLDEVPGGGTGAGLMTTALTIGGIALCTTGVGALAVAGVGLFATYFASASETF